MKWLLYKGKDRLKDKRKVFLIGVAFLLLLVIFIVPSFAALTPVKSVTIESEKLSFSNSDPGAWQITKSAKWTSKGKARITLNVNSVIKPKNEYTDVILVLDTSGSMSENRLTTVKSQITRLINEMIPKGNKLALITFNDTSSIISDFTDDLNTLTNNINSLTAIGNTNYYQAFVNVENILKNYTYEENRDCVVLFLTDGLPNIDTPNEIAQYQNLKANYPYLTINGLQYEMGSELVEALKNISDNQLIANTDNLYKLLYQATVSPVIYDNFEITDDINTNYFNFSSITVTSGTTNINGNKVTWNLDGVESGSELEATIDITLKEELIGVGGIYPTNEKLEIASKIRENLENVTSSLTPILADNYQINYEGNDPEECSVTNIPNPKKVSVFDTVLITEEEPKCEGYQFKGWELVTEGVDKVNANYFIMPEDNVTIRATWSKLSLTKSMEGKVSKSQNLYQMMADNSVPDNVASQYVISSTGINFGAISSDTNGKGIYQAVKLEGENTPIYYYRGAVTNNNLIFANFCWKIVRTTSTDGVKIIYNGAPNEDGSCTATGEDTQIGTSAFNQNAGAIAYNGYMYGNVYVPKGKRADIIGLGGKKEGEKSILETTNYIYSTTVTYDEATGMYTLVDGENRVWDDTYSVGTGNQFLYTCLSETVTNCKEIYYITQSTRPSTIYYARFTGGELAEDTLNKEIMYGNDVIYDEATGMYTLQTTIKSKIGNWATDKAKIEGTNGYHYTCFNETGVCSTVNYITYISSITARSSGVLNYAQFSNGITVDEALKEMTTESKHTTDSTIKIAIDTWYKNNMTIYTDRLEDTPWCNDRTISGYGAWTKNGKATEYLDYKVHIDTKNYQLQLTCQTKNNAYTVNDTNNGNGALTYPVSLLTAAETIYAGGTMGTVNTTHYLYTGNYWWTLSPCAYRNYAYGTTMASDGRIISYATEGYVMSINGVRPTISLAPGTRSMDGNGSPEDPFIVE